MYRAKFFEIEIRIKSLKKGENKGKGILESLPCKGKIKV